MPLYACPQCLRRSWLLTLLGPDIERLATASGWRRSADLLKLDDAALARLVAPGRAPDLLRKVGLMDDDFFAERIGEADCWAICAHDRRFPRGAGSAPHGPRVLFGRGRRSAIEGLAPAAAVTVVGSCRATPYGRRTARDLGCELSAAGMTVVSGLGFGIDACAHLGALDAAGTTIAVLPCGPEVVYPAANRPLWHRIADQGAVVSELPPGSTLWRWTFPARSRVMAALTGMTVVVEASVRSGSLLAAEAAAELDRVVGIVPGPAISRASAGSNRLHAEGALAIREARDVFAAMIPLAGEGQQALAGAAPH